MTVYGTPDAVAEQFFRNIQEGPYTLNHIKGLRAVYRFGLKESKEVIDKLEEMIANVETPEQRAERLRLERDKARKHALDTIENVVQNSWMNSSMKMREIKRLVESAPLEVVTDDY